LGISPAEPTLLVEALGDEQLFSKKTPTVSIENQ